MWTLISSFFSSNINTFKWVLAGLLLSGSFWFGHSTTRDHYEAILAQQKEKQAQLEAKAAEVTTQVVTKYVTQVQTIHEKGEDIIHEIPTYIHDDKCVIPTGFVWIHNAAASGDAVTPSGADDAPSGVDLTAVAETITNNYTEYRALAKKLESLQEWVLKQNQIKEQ